MGIRKKLTKLFLAAFLGVVGNFALFVTPAQALTGLSVTPAYVRVDVPRGEKVQYTSVVLKNDTASAVTLKATMNDVDLNSTELTSLTTANSAATKAVTVTNPTLTLESEQSANLILRVDTSNLGAGGHYTSVVIKQVIAANKKNVPINQGVSVGMFIVKEEGAQRTLSLLSRLISGIRLSPPKNLSLQFKADGNVALVPRAAITVMEGEEVRAKSTINDRSQVLHPGSLQDYKIQFQYQKPLSPGRHKVKVTYRYDGQAVPLVKESTFWYVPFWYVILILGGLAIFLKYVRRYLKPLEVKMHDLVVPAKVAPQAPEVPDGIELAPVTVEAIESLSMPLPTEASEPLAETPKKSPSKKKPAKKPTVAKTTAKKAKKTTTKKVAKKG